MLLSEAAKTGRRFRRKSNPEIWFYLEGTSIMFVFDGSKAPPGKCTFNAEQLIAGDWEPEPKLMMLSAQDLLDAAKNLNNDPITHQRRLAPIEFTKLMIRELGLEE